MRGKSSITMGGRSAGFGTFTKQKRREKVKKETIPRKKAAETRDRPGLVSSAQLW